MEKPFEAVPLPLAPRPAEDPGPFGAPPGPFGRRERHHAWSTAVSLAPRPSGPRLWRAGRGRGGIAAGGVSARTDRPGSSSLMVTMCPTGWGVAAVRAGGAWAVSSRRRDRHQQSSSKARNRWPRGIRMGGRGPGPRCSSFRAAHPRARSKRRLVHRRGLAAGLFSHRGAALIWRNAPEEDQATVRHPARSSWAFSRRGKSQNEPAGRRCAWSRGARPADGGGLGYWLFLGPHGQPGAASPGTLFGRGG